MECKALTIFHGGVNTVCFNRNIVECKGAYSKGESAEELVLIETLWNVKCRDSRIICMCNEF